MWFEVWDEKTGTVVYEDESFEMALEAYLGCADDPDIVFIVHWPSGDIISLRLA